MCVARRCGGWQQRAWSEKLRPSPFLYPPLFPARDSRERRTEQAPPPLLAPPALTPGLPVVLCPVAYPATIQAGVVAVRLAFVAATAYLAFGATIGLVLLARTLSSLLWCAGALLPLLLTGEPLLGVDQFAADGDWLSGKCLLAIVHRLELARHLFDGEDLKVEESPSPERYGCTPSRRHARFFPPPSARRCRCRCRCGRLAAAPDQRDGEQSHPLSHRGERRGDPSLGKASGGWPYGCDPPRCVSQQWSLRHAWPWACPQGWRPTPVERRRGEPRAPADHRGNQRRRTGLRPRAVELASSPSSVGSTCSNSSW